MKFLTLIVVRHQCDVRSIDAITEYRCFYPTPKGLTITHERIYQSGDKHER